MKTHELSASLKAFGSLAESTRSRELETFAAIFSGGKEETVAARLKRLPSGLGLPASVKSSLEAIEAGLHALGAARLVGDVRAVLDKFNGRADGDVHELVQRIKSTPTVTTRTKKKQVVADQVLAKELADALEHSFDKVIERLSDTKQVSTPTLHAVACLFLNNNKEYSGRKPVIAAIVKRHKEDVRDSSRRAAVLRAN